MLRRSIASCYYIPVRHVAKTTEDTCPFVARSNHTAQDSGQLRWNKEKKRNSAVIVMQRRKKLKQVYIFQRPSREQKLVAQMVMRRNVTSLVSLVCLRRERHVLAQNSLPSKHAKKKKKEGTGFFEPDRGLSSWYVARRNLMCNRVHCHKSAFMILSPVEIEDRI